ncbi:acyltransferase domain-containing protein [Streptomyces sp. AK04-3B]|uniref:acyltransferase domain-containing protein n=1 Tax=unclassified Streptomyces TaxID=2593676 RepID=UPI0029A324A9|nr:acyltransferase domain-containing protein [Streptomyces sp. AK04-3B]MDX3799939.1 acyltransferase domain-containing protein [Streptomyces sp. AK04-3B]
MPLTAQQPNPPVALVFPGQGAQYPRMAAGLYGHDSTFTYWMDEAFRLLASDGPRLRREWLAEAPSADYDDVTVAQPLLYAVNHALGRMVLGWGVRPAAIIGHSVGEVAAATLAGILGFEDGIRLMRDRVVHFADTPPGGMLAVAASPDDVADLLGEDVHLAAVNAARQLLLAGEREPLARAARELDGRGVICRPVQARQAFHSPAVDDAVRATLPGFRAVPLRRPAFPFYSAYTPGRLADQQALDPDFWAWQAARTVYFAPALTALLAAHDCLLLEAGPGDGLSRLARRQPRVIARHSSVQALVPGGGRDDREAVDEVRRRLTLVAAGDRHDRPGH